MTNLTVVPFKPNPEPPNSEEDFITRHDIRSMSDDALDEFLNAIRVRRMASYETYKRTVADKQAVLEERALEKLDKKCEQIVKKLATIDKQFEDLETYVNQLRGLRIQAGLELI